MPTDSQELAVTHEIAAPARAWLSGGTARVRGPQAVPFHEAAHASVFLRTRRISSDRLASFGGGACHAFKDRVGRVGGACDCPIHPRRAVPAVRERELDRSFHICAHCFAHGGRAACPGSERPSGSPFGVDAA